MSTGPLDGIRVIDMTRVVAGPLAAQTLADFGADVIKIERPGGGDDSRAVGPPWTKDAEGNDTNTSTYFQCVNRNKRSLALDFAQEEGAALLRRLVVEADVLIENYRTGTLARYGLGFEELSRLNPRLIYCSITGFGQDGPYSNRSGYDYLIQAMGGVMSVTGGPEGEPGGEPTRVGVPIADILAGMNSAIGILAALKHRDVTGEGQHIDIGLLDSQVGALLNPFASWLNNREEIPRTGNYHPTAAPYGPFPTADGRILIATFNDREFTRLAGAVDRPQWLKDPRFGSLGLRVANRKALADEITAALSTAGNAEWIERLNQHKVSCGPINGMAELEHDPQILARNMIVSVPQSDGRDIRLAANPVRFSKTPVTYRSAAPAIGEHTTEILSDWIGLDEEAVARLRSQDVVVQKAD